jgi:hypothetical protein
MSEEEREAEEEREVVAYMALKKERTRLAWRIRTEISKGVPAANLSDLTKRLEIMDQSIAKYEEGAQIKKL